MSLINEISTVFNQEIEFIVNKFDNVRSKNNVLKWINNFDDNEKIFSLDILQLYTYISQEEVRRMSSLIMQQILDSSAVNSHIYMIPIDSYGKSSSLLAYYLRKTTAFKQLQLSEKINFLDNPYLLETTLFHKDDRIILFDDFFGTGYSLIKEIRKLKINLNQSLIKIIDQAEAWGLFYMPQCLKNIKDGNYKISINAEVHYPLFGHSPCFFETSPLANKYKIMSHDSANRKGLFFSKTDKHNLGYKNCEAFISFAHTTPNNTLPIIWSDKAKWYPIFGVSENAIFNILKEKKQALIKLALDNNFSIKFDETINGKFQLSSYLLYGILYFIQNKWAEPRIIKYLGINIESFDFFIEIAINKKLLTKNDITCLSEKGVEFLREINNEILRAKKEKQMSTLSKIDYIAKEFSG